MNWAPDPLRASGGGLEPGQVLRPWSAILLRALSSEGRSYRSTGKPGGGQMGGNLRTHHTGPQHSSPAYAKFVVSLIIVLGLVVGFSKIQKSKIKNLYIAKQESSKAAKKCEYKFIILSFCCFLYCFAALRPKGFQVLDCRRRISWLRPGPVAGWPAGRPALPA